MENEAEKNFSAHMGTTPLMKTDIDSALDDLIRDPRPQGDLSKEVSEAIESSELLNSSGRFADGYENLIQTERKCRLIHDSKNVIRLCEYIVNHYYNIGDVKEALSNLKTLCGKRSQLKLVISRLVHVGQGWLDNLMQRQKSETDTQKSETEKTIYEILECLNTITEGKLFVEVERARLLLMLALIKEKQGEVEVASSILQDVHVESCPTMEPKEKAEYILEQLRLLLKSKDWVKIQITSKKIPPSLLASADFELIKLKFNAYLQHYWLIEKEFLTLHESCSACLKTTLVSNISAGQKTTEDFQSIKMFYPHEDLSKWFLELAVLFLLLAKRNEQQKKAAQAFNSEYGRILQRTSPLFSYLLKSILVETVFIFDSESHPKETDELKKHAAFQREWLVELDATADKEKSMADDETTGFSASRWELLRVSLLKRNLSVVSQYYQEHTLQGLANLLKITEDEIESTLCALVKDGVIKCKINRPKKICKFGASEFDDKQLLTNWTKSIGDVIDLADEANHLIDREHITI